MDDVVIRPLAATDSLAALTVLLHRAYARLAEMGLNFTATDQSVEVTAQRVASGTCFVATRTDSLIGTVTVRGPYDLMTEPWAAQTPWFVRRDVAHLHQLAVDPGCQGAGLGSRLVETAEQWAMERGFSHMLLDTALPATHLLTRYLRLGYRQVDEVQWKGKTYRSAIMAKPLLVSRKAAYRRVLKSRGKFKWEGDDGIDWLAAAEPSSAADKPDPVAP